MGSSGSPARCTCQMGASCVKYAQKGSSDVQLEKHRVWLVCDFYQVVLECWVGAGGGVGGEKGTGDMVHVLRRVGHGIGYGVGQA